MTRKVLYHGSPKPLEGDALIPSQGDDSDERSENNMLAVYATDCRDLAIVMAFIGCKDVIGGTIDEYQDGKLNARLYGNYPTQKYIYLHKLPRDTFKQTKIDTHQFVSLVAVTPISTEKILVQEYTHLARMATESETKKWCEKYLPNQGGCKRKSE